MRQLLASGYKAADIEAAMIAAGYSGAEVQQGWKSLEVVISQEQGQLYFNLSDQGRDQATQPQPKENYLASPVFWSVLVGFVVLSLGIWVLLFVVGSSLTNSPPFFLGAFVVLQIAAFFTWLAMRNRNPALARGLAVGLLIIDVIIPATLLVNLLVFFGLCLAGLVGLP